MPQVAMRAGFPHLVGASAAAAVLALLALSGHAGAVGEVVEAFPADVFQGDQFHANVTVPSLGEPTGVQVKVTCPTCGPGWTTAPLSNWRQVAPGSWRRAVDFPGVLFPGSAAGEPKWAQNYTVQVVGTNAAANVTVHAIDDWLQPDGVYEVTRAVRFHIAGVPAGSHAFVNLSKWTRTGALQVVENLRLASVNGIAEYDYRIPKEHAADMTCPASGRCRDYLATITAGGRTERVEFHARPAVLHPEVTYRITDPLGEPLLPLGPGPLAFNRTENVSIHVDVAYHNNGRLTGADRSLAGNASLNGTLKLAVERVTVAQAPDGNQTQTLLERVQVLFAKPYAQGWRASWLIPRNVTATQAGAENPQYRVRVLAQEDRFGNDLADTNATAFRVYPLRLQPQLVGVPLATVERLTNATAIYNVKYADGSPWTNTTNDTAMRASLVDEEGDTVASAELKYLQGGTWRVSFQPGMRFRPLGFYKLRIHENQDRDDNVLVQTDTEFFEIVPARPRVELVTKVGHEARNETEGFARGERIQVQAVLRYADGTPFNLTRLPLGQNTLELNISRVDEHGEVRAYDPVPLQPQDDQGRWAAVYHPKDFDDDAPLGDWLWRLRVSDVESPPNVNDTSFLRPMRGAPLQVEVVRHPEPVVRAGEPVTMRFEGRYPWPDSTLLTDALGGSGLRVLVQPWVQGQAGAPAAILGVAWSEDRLDWGTVWHTNRTTLVGDYVFTLTGTDVYGNLLPEVRTRPFTVFVDQLQRQVLREPPENVTRGETVLVLFDGAEGDFGEQGFDGPRIELQKWNPLRSAWEKERTNVRLNSTEHGSDHVARLETDSATNLGRYRFVLVARNDQHALVQAESRAFRIAPVEVQRSWLPGANETVAEPVVKGASMTLPLERRDGDQVTSVGFFRDGERLANGTSLLKTGRYDVSLRTSFALPDGLYQVLVRGRDVHNNTFESAPLWINLTGVDLTARVPAPPAAALQRADRIELRALLQYPDETHAKAGQFTARFVRDNVTVATRELALDRASWLLNWTPPPDAPLGQYRVLLQGDDGLGNRVQDDEVFSFQLATGVIERAFTLQRTLANRTENVVWMLPAKETDAAVRFVLRDEAGGRRELPYNVSVGGDYVVQWRPSKSEALTRYTLTAEGMDTGDNALFAESRVLTVRAGQLGVSWVEDPGGFGKSVPPGQALRWEFQLQYRDGLPVPANAQNLPRVGVVDPRDKLVEPGPTLTASASGDRWVVTWTPLAGKHTETYRLVIGARDQHNNVLNLNTASKTITVDEGFLKEYLGVPGVEAAAAPLALLGAALMLRRRGERGP